MNTSGPATLVTEQDNSVGVILDESVVCPDCRYCLCSLPRRSTCPECGLKFEWSPPDLELAIEKFTAAFPRWIRPLIKPRSTRLRKTRWSLLISVALAVVVSAAFILAHYWAVWLCMKLCDPDSRLMGSTAIVSYRLASRRDPVQWNDGTTFVFLVSVFGQMAIGYGFLMLSAFARRKLTLRKVSARRLTGYALATIPLLACPSMMVVTLWQSLNVTYPMLAPTFRIRFPLLLNSCGDSGYYIDRIWALGFGLLTLTAAISSVWWYRMNRNAIRGAIAHLNEFKPPSPSDSDPIEVI